MGYKKVPQIRFMGFDDDYELRTIGDLTENYQIVNKQNLKLQSYSITNESGFVKQKSFFERGGKAVNADKSKSIIVNPNSFAYNPARIDVKSIGYYEPINKNDCLISPMYDVFKTKNKNNDYWLWYWLKSDILQKDVKKFKEGSVRLTVYYNVLKLFSIITPSINEQQKISQLIKTIDNKIDKSQKNLKYIKEFRNELLNKMIVQNHTHTHTHTHLLLDLMVLMIY